VGHGTLAQGDLAHLLRSAGIELLADVRTFPGSRRHPQVNREALERWLPEAGIAYRWLPGLGGFRRPLADSPNAGLRHPSFRGYADHMDSPEFEESLCSLLSEAGQRVTAVMCSETLWWRCHRRLLADAVELHGAATVRHLDHHGQLQPHRLTEGAHLEGEKVRYGGQQPRLSGPSDEER
jgi:uncharacterized protein (DUF488 family)